MLNGKVAMIKVGAGSKVEMKEKKDRVEDAIYATKAALQEGIVAGGGVALLDASFAIVPENEGEVILLQSIKSPYATILDNAALEYKEYRDYLGINKFEDYIYIPQQFACDDIEATSKLVEDQLKNAKSKIFLEGIGHAKQALLWRMKEFHPAVYISVGCGICAIAGVQDCVGRPYFANWKNYRIKRYDYGKVDIWKETELEKIVWL